MKRMLTAVLLATALLPIRGHAQGGLPQLPELCGQIDPTVAPFAILFVDDICVNLSDLITSGPKPWTLSVSELEVGPVLINSLTAGISPITPDPRIFFEASTTNLVPGPVTYAFFFGTPIAPDFHADAQGGVMVMVTSGATGLATVANSAIYPTFVSSYGTLGGAATNLGLNVGTVPCTAGPGAPSGTTHGCNYGTAVPSSFAPTFYDNLEALLTYTQTDAASVASWSGRVVLETAAVPEPASMLLMGSGLVGIALVARRRRRTPAE